MKIDWNKFAALIGLSESSAEVAEAFIHIEELAFVRSYPLGTDKQSRHYCFYRSGLEFSFSEKRLNSIYIYLNATVNYQGFAGALPFGIDAFQDLESIINIFGEPKIRGKSNKWVKYPIENNNFIHFEFNEVGRLSMITLLR